MRGLANGDATDEDKAQVSVLRTVGLVFRSRIEVGMADGGLKVKIFTFASAD